MTYWFGMDLEVFDWRRWLIQHIFCLNRFSKRIRDSVSCPSLNSFTSTSDGFSSDSCQSNYDDFEDLRLLENKSSSLKFDIMSSFATHSCSSAFPVCYTYFVSIQFGSSKRFIDLFNPDSWKLLRGSRLRSRFLSHFWHTLKSLINRFTLGFFRVYFLRSIRRSRNTKNPSRHEVSTDRHVIMCGKSELGTRIWMKI